MKVPLHLVQERRQRLAELLQQHAYLPVQEVCRVLGVSEATARRDLSVLEKEKRIIRTFGGALSEFNRGFASFHERLAKGAEGKRAIAQVVRGIIRPGGSCFLDTGTTVYAIAECLAAHPVGPLRVVTNSLPVAEKLAPVTGVEVFLTGGQYLPRQSALMGSKARRALALHRIDQAFLSAEGADRKGIWNSQAEVVEFQRALLAHAGVGIFCIDRTKIGHGAANFLIPWKEVGLLVTDAAARELRAAGISIDLPRLQQTGHHAP